MAFLINKESKIRKSAFANKTHDCKQQERRKIYFFLKKKKIENQIGVGFTSNNRDVHVFVSVNKNVHSVLKDLMI